MPPAHARAEMCMPMLCSLFEKKIIILIFEWCNTSCVILGEQRQKVMTQYAQDIFIRGYNYCNSFTWIFDTRGNRTKLLKSNVSLSNRVPTTQKRRRHALDTKFTFMLNTKRNSKS